MFFVLLNKEGGRDCCIHPVCCNNKDNKDFY